MTMDTSFSYIILVNDATWTPIYPAIGAHKNLYLYLHNNI